MVLGIHSMTAVDLELSCRLIHSLVLCADNSMFGTCLLFQLKSMVISTAINLVQRISAVIVKIQPQPNIHFTLSLAISACYTLTESNSFPRLLLPQFTATF